MGRNLERLLNGFSPAVLTLATDLSSLPRNSRYGEWVRFVRSCSPGKSFEMENLNYLIDMYAAYRSDGVEPDIAETIAYMESYRKLTIKARSNVVAIQAYRRRKDKHDDEYDDGA